jgi:hypothetical protein
VTAVSESCPKPPFVLKHLSLACIPASSFAAVNTAKSPHLTTARDMPLLVLLHCGVGDVSNDPVAARWRQFVGHVAHQPCH